MKKLLVLATTLCVIASGSVLAAPSDNRPSGPMTKPATGQRPGVMPPGGGAQKPGGRPPSNIGQKPGGNPPGNIGRPPAKPPSNINRPPAHRPPPSNGWHKPRPNQWYWRGNWYTRIHGPAFRYPPGYSYRRWDVGQRLPALLLVTPFFYDNVVSLGLQAPPLGYRWVRYGPDLVLVNLRTREVEQVAYGVFL